MNTVQVSAFLCNVYAVVHVSNLNWVDGQILIVYCALPIEFHIL